MTRLAALVLLWVACCGWTQPISWRYPTTNVDGTPLTDLDHAEITLRQCTGDSLRLPPIPATGMEGDSVAVDLTGISETIHHLIIEVRAVDHSGNRSDLTSLLVAHEATEAPPPGPGGIVGEYYHGSKNNSFLQQFAVRQDSLIDFSWGLGPPLPGAPVDSFCVRWTGTMRVPQGGVDMVYVRSADGIRLWVDGLKVIDNWIYTFPQTWDKAVSLAPGPHDVLLEYFNNVGEAMCVMSWSGPGMARRTINAEEWR